MRRYGFWLLVFGVALLIGFTSELVAFSAYDILDKIDANRAPTTIKYTGKFIIEKRNKRLVKSFYGYGARDGKKFFIEFTNPEDRGIKYLRLGDNLWIYFPEADDVMRISGHMLRQGMMGSDMSYEDMLKIEELRENYTPQLAGDTVYKEQKCYVLELTAKKADVPYYRQRLIVDKTNFVPLKLEFFAKSGRLLKVMEQSDIKKIRNRFIPLKIIVRDMRRRSTKTVIVFEKIELDVSLPKDIFTKESLYR